MSEELARILNEEIARELLLEDYPNATQEEIEFIIKKCRDNGWNAPALYHLYCNK